MPVAWRKMTWADRDFRDWKCDSRHPEWCNERAVWVCEQRREDGAIVECGHACDRHVPREAVEHEEHDLRHGLSASLPHLDSYLQMLRALPATETSVIPSTGGTVSSSIFNLEQQIEFVRRLLGVDRKEEAG